MSDDEIKIPTRYHVPCAMLLDKSGSMSGAPIAALNKALTDFKSLFEENNADNSVIDLCIIAFGGDVEIIQKFAPSNEMDYTKPLEASGGTPMAEAVEVALDEITKRKELYKKNATPYYKPWLVCLTDGNSTEGPTYYNSIKQRLLDETNGNHVTPYGIGVGDGVNYPDLMDFFGENHTFKLLEVNNIGRFKELFQFLKNSFTVKSQSKGAKPTNMPEAKDSNGQVFLTAASFND